jgi:acylaminoacyl-peptidase
MYLRSSRRLFDPICRRQRRFPCRVACRLPRRAVRGRHMESAAPPSAVGEGRYARLWADICQATPSISSARALSDDGSVIAASWSQRDVVASKKRNYTMTYVRRNSSYVPTVPVQSSKAIEYFSPSSRRLVRFVENDGNEGSTEIEVWTIQSSEGDGSCLDAVWKVPAKKHGAIFSDEWYGGVAWSPDENLFIYVADRPKAEPVSSGEDAQDESAQTDADTWMSSCRGKFAQSSRDLLGEAYLNRRSPALFLADVTRGASRAMCVPIDDEVDVEDESQHLYGDPQWSSDGKWVAVTRRPSPLVTPSLEKDNISDKPYELGTRYCYNRYSSVELLSAPDTLEDAATALFSMTPVTDHSDLRDFCCSSPRFSPDSKVLLYLSAPRRSEGRAESSILPHNTTKLLRGACILSEDGDPATSAPVTVIDIVRKARRNDFPGLYLHALPARPWLGNRCAGDGFPLLFCSVWGSDSRVLQADISVVRSGSEACLQPLQSHDVRDVTPTFATHLPSAVSVSVLDVSKEGAVVAFSSPLLSPQIAFARYEHSDFDCAVPAQLVSRPSRRARELEVIGQNNFASKDLIRVDGGSSDCDASLAAEEFVEGQHDEARRFQVTLVLPRAAESTKVPLIVYPHGGPHSSSVNSFSQGVAAMLSCGLAVMHVNFGGSLGLGQDSVDNLPGKAGFADVSEVLQATQWALSKGATSCLDPGLVGYVGGSHGGFLGAHCSVVEGNLFKAVALRNPVCNIASMVNVTDIPEWAFCEAGVAAVSKATGLALSADPAALAKMWAVSPVARVRKGGPKPGRTVLFVGSGDRRVPPEQSIEWQRLVTEAHGAGVVTLRWYPESGHSIDEVPNGDDVWVHTLELFSSLQKNVKETP